MIEFLKKNGYPVDLIFDTETVKPTSENSDCKYKTKVLVNGVLIDEWQHRSLRYRASYAKGFFEGMKAGKKG